MVTSLPLVSCKDGVCSSFVLRKHHRDSFDKCASWHASVSLELVHSDLCGPIPSASFSSFIYFLTFIDDYFRRTWVYFLKLKSEVFNMFLAYKALVEKQSGHQIICNYFVNHIYQDVELDENLVQFCVLYGLFCYNLICYSYTCVLVSCL